MARVYKKISRYIKNNNIVFFIIYLKLNQIIAFIIIKD